MVLRVGDKKLSVLDPDPLRTAHGLGVRNVAARDRVVGEIGLSHHDVGRNAVGRGDLAPNQNSIVIGIGDRDDSSIGSHAGRRPHTGLGDGDVGCREILLTQNDVGHSEADRTNAVVGELVGRLRESGGETLENQDALIHRGRPDTVRVHHEQHVAGIGDTAHPTDQILLRALHRFREGTLTNDEPGGLARGKLGRGRHYGGE